MPSFHDEVINTGNTLAEIAQENLIKGQCRIFRKEFRRLKRGKNPRLTTDQYNRAKVLCGKDTFINLGMKTNIGVPVALLKALEQYEGFGPRMSELGLLDDKSWSKERWPFGFVKAKHAKPLAFKRITTNKVVGISCAACHAGQLPDGRFSIGMTNESFKYGDFNQYTLFSIWMIDKRKYDETRWLPELIKKYSEMKSKNKGFFLKMITASEKMPINKFMLKSIIGEEPPSLATQRSFINSEPGIFNGFAPSLNFKDKELYVSAPGIWGLGSENESHYGTLAARTTPEDFISEAFIYTNRSTRYNQRAYLEPMAEYLKCLKSPKSKMKKNIPLYQTGKKLFKNNCTSCHDLNHGGGSVAIDPVKMGAPHNFSGIFENYQPEDIQSIRTFKLLQKLGLDDSANLVKVRRLNGIWTRKNLTSNGQIKGFDHLFCLGGKKRDILDPNNPKTQGIHKDLCDDYTKEEKKALKEFLKNF